MAYVRRIGFFPGYDFDWWQNSPDKRSGIWPAAKPITQQEVEAANPGALQNPTLFQLSYMMRMPFYEFMDFQWRVKNWAFSSISTLLEKNEYYGTDTTSELELATVKSVFTARGNAHGFINRYQVPCAPDSPEGSVCSRTCWLQWGAPGSGFAIYAFGPAELQKRDDQYVNLSYGPAISTQSFAGPSNIVKTGYLQFDVSFANTYGAATVVSISPAQWWTYGGRYDAATGAER
jgi:hypothetical protein